MACGVKCSVFGFVVVTDRELRCDVKVDVIDSIEIVSRTRELYVDDAPLELMAQALDAAGEEPGAPTASGGTAEALRFGRAHGNLRDRSGLERTFLFLSEAHVHVGLVILSIVQCVS